MNSNCTHQFRPLFWFCVILTIVIILIATFANISLILRIILDVIALFIIISGALFYSRSRSTPMGRR